MSDLDLLVVVDGPLAEHVRHRAARAFLRAFDRRPTTGGIEVSIVQARDARHFVHPLLYEVHFSERWADSVRGGGAGPRGADPDLAAHVTVTRARGIALRGPAAADVFGPVPHEAFLASILDDLDWIISGNHILDSPFYGVLNACRALQVLSEGPGSVPSKDEGAAWALDRLPLEHHQIISEARECYRSSASVRPEQRRAHGHTWEVEPLWRFAAHVRAAVPGSETRS
jgi:streptomycin 3"-adenylyltransferase